MASLKRRRDADGEMGGCTALVAGSAENFFLHSSAGGAQGTCAWWGQEASAQGFGSVGGGMMMGGGGGPGSALFGHGMSVAHGFGGGGGGGVGGGAGGFAPGVPAFAFLGAGGRAVYGPGEGAGAVGLGGQGSSAMWEAAPPQRSIMAGGGGPPPFEQQQHSRGVGVAYERASQATAGDTGGVGGGGGALMGSSSRVGPSPLSPAPAEAVPCSHCERPCSERDLQECERCSQFFCSMCSTKKCVLALTMPSGRKLATRLSLHAPHQPHKPHKTLPPFPIFGFFAAMTSARTGHFA
jgi:hypothetical protein